MKPSSVVLKSILIAGAVCLTGCGVAVRQVASGYRGMRYSSMFQSGRRGPLSPAETDWAKIAWKYFQNNTEGTAGIAGGLDKRPVASAWNIADYLAALNSAHDLGIVKDAEFLDRATRVVQFLNTMELFDHQLPNRYYNSQSGAMVDAGNTPAETGWSAIELGRLLIWLRITSQSAPHLAEYIDKAVLRWNFCDIVGGDGTLYAGNKTAAKTLVTQEGRLGYQQYAALGFQAWGFDTRQASRMEPVSIAHIGGIDVPYDSRDPRSSNVYAPVVTLPHTLMGIEFNWEATSSRGGQDKERPMARLAQSIYDVQEERYRKDHILTARTDHVLNRSPNFVYDTIFLAGYSWNTLDGNGGFAPQEALVSTSAAFGMWALWKTDYTKTLIEAARMLNDPGRGWFEGRLERTGGPEPTASSTTNTAVLEALAYMKTGRLFRASMADRYYTRVLRSEFSGSANLPSGDQIGDATHGEAHTPRPALAVRCNPSRSAGAGFGVACVLPRNRSRHRDQPTACCASG